MQELYELMEKELANADLLKEGKHNMSEIAWMTGFNTLSHFSTSFKKQFGVPPSEYVG
ncbi:MAG: helix-turn-helix domain-containing protein [Bacteroidales bacterium]|nr:helix-turn-helix domain-containing protein [Bacteroidales bacterium]